MISRKEICACMNIFEKIYRQYLSMAGSSEAKRKYLIKKGAKIGAGTIIHGALNTFGTEPYLIEVGVNCLFAYDVRLITHDGGVNVLNNLNMLEIKCDKMGKITIGNNSYFGMGSFVMPNVHIGDNCIIGAMSVVTRDVPDNTVVAGIPAKQICTVNEYYEKAKNNLFPTKGLSQEAKRKYFEEHPI